MILIRAFSIYRRTLVLTAANIVALTRVVWLPMLASAFVFFVATHFYFNLLIVFLNDRSARAASLALACAVAGLFLWLLLCALASAGVVETLRTDIAAPHRVMRLYAALLRLMLPYAVFVCLWVAAVWRLPMPEFLGTVLEGGIFVMGSLWLGARCALLLPAVAMLENGFVLRRAWRLTAGKGGLMVKLLVGLILVPALAVDWLGEAIYRSFASPRLPSIATEHMLTAANIGRLSAALPALSGIFTVAVAICLVLATVGSVATYDALARNTG